MDREGNGLKRTVQVCIHRKRLIPGKVISYTPKYSRTV